MSAPRVSLPDRYTDLRHLADGGMASVWEATDTVLGRPVAVKVLSSALAADPEARRRFTREARAAGRLSSHPHVVTVYDAGEHEGEAYLVMALYPGGTVADRIARGPVPQAQALDWLEDAASALDLAHAEGVVHRDVKPANLLLDAHDHVAVADFGIATAAWETAMTSTGLVLGTLAYLAPEQRTGGAATPATDRYALGLVARHLLTGAGPGAVPAPGREPAPALQAVLERASAEAPGDRPASCAMLVAELDRALGEQNPTAATRALPRPRGAPVPLGAQEPTTVQPTPRAVPRTPHPPSAPARHQRGTPRPVLAPGTDGPRRRASPLAVLAALALLVAGGAVAVAAFDGTGKDTPTRSTRAKTTKPKRTAPSTSAATPAPAPSASTAATTPPPTTTSRAALIAQNDAAFKATDADPAAQVAPLREAVAGLCVDESDINCAFALFNLARALRLSDQPAEAIPLLERRLRISDDKTDVVRAELARAQQAAGVAPAAGDAPSGKRPKPGKQDKAGKQKGE